jgi:DUF4097 and DUF4098 domain-containing protein YvlB
MFRFFLSSIAILVSLSDAGSQSDAVIQKTGRGYLQRIEARLETTPGKTLRFHTDRGAIQLHTSDKPEVTENEARAIFKAFVISTKKEGDDVVITAESPKNRKSRSFQVKFVLTVPGTYNAMLDTQGGSIEVSDLIGSLDAHTSGGSIEVGQITDGSVVLKTSGGSINLGGVQNGSAQVHTAGGSISVGDVTGDVAARTAGGSINIGQVGGGLITETAGGSIAIASSQGAMQAKTAGGSIKIDGAGNEVNASTAGGSINVRNAKGPLTLETSGGSISLENTQSTVEAKTSGGFIRVNGATGPVIVSTAGGDISIKGAAGAIEAETSGGDISAEMIQAPPGVNTHCYLETSAGDVTLYMPANRAATLFAQLRVKGRGSHKSYKIKSDFEIEISKPSSHTTIARAKINGGGDPIRLKTTNGDINIIKSNQ